MHATRPNPPEATPEPAHEQDKKPSARVTVKANINRQLDAHARRHGEQRGLTMRHVVELALAEYFNLPAYNPTLGYPGLCPQCDKAVITNDKCDLCNWHANPRPWAPNTRTRQTTNKPPQTRKRAP